MDKESALNYLTACKYESYNYSKGTYNETPEMGENLAFSDLNTRVKTSEYYLINFVQWGDYSGDTVSRANYDTIIKKWGKNPLVWSVVGGHWSHGILIHADILENDDFLEIFESIENYPVLDDEHLTELELSIQDSAWDDWVRSDLDSALDNLGIEILDRGEEFENHFYKITSLHNIEYIHEDAVGVYIDVEKIAQLWDKIPICHSCEDELSYFGQKCPVCPTLF